MQSLLESYYGESNAIVPASFDNIYAMAYSRGELDEVWKGELWDNSGAAILAGTIYAGVSVGKDLISPSDQQHILYGDANGGGHLFPGKPGHTPFPASWTEQQILDNIADIVTDQKTTWYVQTGNGGTLTSKGDPARWRAWETRDGVQMRVEYEPATGRVVTALPDASAPRGPIVPK